MEAQRETLDADLAAELRRIRLIASIAAGVWAVATAILTVYISNRVLSSSLAATGEGAKRDASEIGNVVNTEFRELAAIPRVLSSNEDLRAIVTRYDAKGDSFARLTPEMRRQQLSDDVDVVRVSRRLLAIRNDLNTDLIYATESHGIGVASSDWDRPMTPLGTQFADRDYFKESMLGRTGQLFAVARTERRNAVVFFSAPIPGATGPIGVVAAAQDSGVIGAALSGRRHVTFIVDTYGMVVASSAQELTLHHVGPLSSNRPDARELHDTYEQDTLQTLDIRPADHSRPDEWVLNGHPYLLKRATLNTPRYSLLVLLPIEQLEAVRPLHYTIGALAALFGGLVALLGQRRAEGLARRRHSLKITAELNKKLQALNHEKDRYLGIAAHDLRNPLGAVRGYSELMLEGSLEPEQQKEFLQSIRRTSDEMLGLVNDLLDISVIESGKLELRRSNQDVSQLLQERIHLLDPYARSKKSVIQVEAIEGLQASIDGPRFAQVIDNLVSNAIKFSPGGSTVRVALSSCASGFAFAVRDQGPGIPEQDRKLLFRTFQKLSARPTGGERSTGLGLAIVKKIIDAHGGQIEVDDAPGGGTRFTVTIPSESAERLVVTTEAARGHEHLGAAQGAERTDHPPAAGAAGGVPRIDGDGAVR